MVPGGIAPQPIEAVYEPLSSSQVLGVQRQPQYDELGNFIGYKKVSSKVLNTEAPESIAQKYELMFQPTDDPNMLLAVHRKPTLDQYGNVVGYEDVKSQLVPKEEAAKFKDVTTQVRAGGTDLSNPEELYQLYKNLREKSQYGQYGFGTSEAKQATGELIRDVQGQLRQAIPELKTSDAAIAALKKGANLLGADMDLNLDAVDEQKVMQQVVELINQQEAIGSSGAIAREKVNQFINTVRPFYPDLAQRAADSFKELGERTMAAKDVSGLFRAGALNTIKRSAMAAGNVVGGVERPVYQGVEALGKAAKSKITAAGQAVYNLTPDSLRMKGEELLLSPTSQAAKELGKVLTSLPDKDERTRNAILFGLMQNPAYRRWLNSEENEEGVK